MIKVLLHSYKFSRLPTYHISWNAIPAWVCDQCGESLFETHEVELIQEALTVSDRETADLVSSSSP
ncbi:YgiT-type zinc finger protein [Dolichospermum compactum]|uniref:YgiT-type zinc finger protein n=1 Tax=Dolichospermum compactum NIES-806 TaxID=1973481 RepID=A0A1Z4V6R4_9CYAN|nr:YgiT-type zinc finger protein [Dolichospermum compactum]BAZ87246.1 hypothetical protein NIES806_34670 [Dolichospermum compactum NIES-806]